MLGIHFAKTQRQKTQKILDGLNKRTGEDFQYSRLERMPSKPYPDAQAIINAYELGCIKAPEAKQLSPMALWDLHYLRELDNSGFIDKLYKESAKHEVGHGNAISHEGTVASSNAALRGLKDFGESDRLTEVYEKICAAEFDCCWFLSAPSRFSKPRPLNPSAAARSRLVSAKNLR